MKHLVAFLTILFVMGVIVTLVPAAPDQSSDTNRSVQSRPTQFIPVNRPLQTPATIVSLPAQAPRVSSGEVEFPIQRGERPSPERTPFPPPTPTVPPATVTIPPTTPHQTASRTPTPTLTVQGTTVPVTQATTPAPVVTVTVFVYPSGPVYQPLYYYPPGYPYYINSYYPTGSLTVTSNPSGATVILDGYNSEITPWIFTGLTTGYHTVEVDYPGYEAYVTNVYVDNGANPAINADLTGLVSYGSLVIDSTPRGADVYVDGNYEGSSPVTVSALSRGPHQVELHLAGYDVLTSTQYVAAGQGTVANLALSRYTASSGYGSININANRAGALVYLDGIYKGSTISNNIFNIISVNPGTHTVLLHVPGYTDFTQSVQVYNGQITNVDAVFTAPSSVVQQGPGTTTQTTGSIIATSSPAGGQVFVDNQFRGVTPVTIYNVATGSHIVNMKLTGYSDWSSSVTVLADQMVQVPATFVPGSGAPSPTRAGLSPVLIISALALGAVILSGRNQK